MSFLSSPPGLVLLGVIVFLAGSFLWNTWQGWNRDINAANQDVTFKHPTGVVPTDVVNRASQAGAKKLFWSFIVVLAVYFGFLRPRYLELLAPIESALKSLLAFLFEVLSDVFMTIAEWLAGSG